MLSYLGFLPTSFEAMWSIGRWFLFTHIFFLDPLFLGLVLAVNEITNDLLILPCSTWGEGVLYLFCLRTIGSNGPFLPLI